MKLIRWTVLCSIGLAATVVFLSGCSRQDSGPPPAAPTAGDDEALKNLPIMQNSKGKTKGPARSK